MPVTEFVILHLKDPNPSSAIKASLREVIREQSAWSKYPVHFFRQIEDPVLVYLLGGWASVAEHFGEWITSEPNQRLLAELKDAVDIDLIFHLDLDPSAQTALLPAPVLAIHRYFVAKGRKAEFEESFKSVGQRLGDTTAPYSYAGGWRIDKDGEDEEFVLFSGWRTVEDHLRFAESGAFKALSEMEGVFKGTDVKHARSEKWE